MLNKAKNKHEDWRTSKKERLAYIVGDNARYTITLVFSAYMTMFLMMKGVDITALAVVTLLIKIIDAMDDVIFGFLVDRIKIGNTKLGKRILGKGKYLPWYRLTFWMFPLATVLFYLMPDNMPTIGKIIWYVVTYLLYDLTYTLCEVPTNTLIMTITEKSDERNHIITTKTIGSLLVIVLASVGGSIIISEFVGVSIRDAGIGFAVISAIFMIPLATSVVEHNVEEKNVEKEEKYTFKQMLGCLKTNKYLFIFLISTLITMTLTSLNSSMALFTGFYIFNNSQASTISTSIALIPGIILMALSPKICKKLGGNKKAIVYILMIFTVCYGLMFAFGRNSMLMYILMGTLVALPNTALGVIKSYVLPDTIEYAKYKTGQDSSGICYALLSFVNKITNSVGPSLGMFIIGLCGWVTVNATDFADLASQNVMQPDSAITALWVTSTLIPAIGGLLGAIVMHFYDLKDEDARLMAECNAGKITREECESRLSKKY